MAGNTQLTDSQIIKVKGKLTEWGLLDPNFADVGDPRIKEAHTNNWNDFCVSGAEEFLRLFGNNNADGLIDDQDADFITSRGEPQPLKPESDKEKKVVAAYQKNDWYVARGVDSYNVLWIEDVGRDWVPVKGMLDAWDDMVLIWQAEHNGRVRLVEEFYQCTTEPGTRFTFNPLNVKGAARISFGQYKAWQRGLHGSGSTAHQGFRQEGRIRVHRDLNEDGLRLNDATEDGIFYCNWHGTTNSPGNVGGWSAGCSVFRYMSELRRFMSILESDRRYRLNKAYMFIGAYIAGKELAKM